AAVQNPAWCFADADLKGGQAAAGPLGLPLTYSGNFASVYRLDCPRGDSWAVKGFTPEAPGRPGRYPQINQDLQSQARRFTVFFRFLDQGVQVNGSWFPALKMRWVEGLTLNEFLRQYASNQAVLEQLSGLWLRLAQEMRDAEMGHGDLQHGNVLLIPGAHNRSLALRLIDYDGMWVPEPAGNPSPENGHPNYQPPQRVRRCAPGVRSQESGVSKDPLTPDSCPLTPEGEGGYFREVDRFSHLVIFTALRAILWGGQPLWARHDREENLLFRE